MKKGTQKTKQKLVTVKVDDLIGKNVSGIIAQVTNPIHFKNNDMNNPNFPDVLPTFRKLLKITKTKENHKTWAILYWERESGDSCNFSGSVIGTECPYELQLKKEDYVRLFNK